MKENNIENKINFEKLISDTCIRTILIKGEWGVGKTFFIDKALTGANIKFKYISLFGISSSEELREAIRDVTDPRIFTNSYFLENNNPVFSFADSGSFIVFDDIERISYFIDISIFLGMINKLVNHGLRIVMILDEKRIADGKQKTAFDNYLEKCVDKIFNLEKPFDDALKEVVPKKFSTMVINAPILEAPNLRELKKATSFYNHICATFKITSLKLEKMMLTDWELFNACLVVIKAVFEKEKDTKSNQQLIKEIIKTKNLSFKEEQCNDLLNYYLTYDETKIKEKYFNNKIGTINILYRDFLLLSDLEQKKYIEVFRKNFNKLNFKQYQIQLAFVNYQNNCERFDFEKISIEDAASFFVVFFAKYESSFEIFKSRLFNSKEKELVSKMSELKYKEKIREILRMFKERNYKQMCDVLLANAKSFLPDDDLIVLMENGGYFLPEFDLTLKFDEWEYCKLIADFVSENTIPINREKFENVLRMKLENCKTNSGKKRVEAIFAILNKNFSN